MNTVKCILVLLAYATTAISCMNSLPTYFYADGSANQYTISPTTLSYDPVTPEESSTGMYSGGEPAEITLTKAQYDALRYLFDAAIERTDIHIPDRIKTSGQLTRTTPAETRTVNLQPHSTELEEIERMLRSLRLSK